jgi:hypothetical protein
MTGREPLAADIAALQRACSTFRRQYGDAALRRALGLSAAGRHEIDDAAVLAEMAIEVFMFGYTEHAAAIAYGSWPMGDETFVSLLEKQRAMEAAGEFGPAYYELLGQICSHHVRQPRPEKECKRLYRKFREQREQLYNQYSVHIAGP